MLNRFLRKEALMGGWRFWLLWVLATNLGFFSGRWLGQALATTFSEPFASGVFAVSFALPVGLLQWLVLRRHLPRSGSWVLTTSVGWGVGALVGAAVMLSAAPTAAPGGLFWIFALAFISGAAVGIAQMPLILRHLPELAPWWVIISVVAWDVFFPGAITGFFLARSPGMRAA